MNLLLWLFAIPFAVVIYSIILQKIISSPILAALSVFAVFLIVAIVQENSTLYIVSIAYAILSYITAVLTNLIRRIINRCSYGNNEATSFNSINNLALEVNKDTLDATQNVINDNSCGCGCRRSR